MKRLLLLILALIPSLAFGAFTEFYVDPTNGNNINSGSDAGTSVYTSTNGNWSTTTHIFTPTDGSNPATASPGVSVGQFASIYNDGATLVVFIGRVTAVTNATNGAITIVGSSGAGTAGTAPVTSATGRSIKVGGAWKGCTGTTGVPMNSLANMFQATDASSHVPRINCKNNASQVITGGISWTPGGLIVVQGYSSTIGDGGKADISTSNSAGQISTGAGITLIDLTFTGTASSGSSSLLSISSANSSLTRVAVHGARGEGITVNAGATLTEVECYGNNTSNTANKGGVLYNGTVGLSVNYCYFHDNTGSNSSGIDISGSGAIQISNSIFDTNGSKGILVHSGTAFQGLIGNNDFYNNTSDAIADSVGCSLNIRNNNFIKNGGAAINITGTATGFSTNNGYGSGTQANTSGDTLSGLIDSGTSVTYASGVTPWVDPANGDFRINLTAANWAGRGAFTETDSSLSAPNTVGYPDIGAAQSKTGPSGTFTKETSSGHAQ